MSPITTNAKRKRNVGQSVLQSTTLHMQPPVAVPAATIHSARRPLAVSKNQEPPGRTLDGFMLLDCCRVEFPDEVAQAVLSGLNITNVVSEDLLFFSNLSRLDLSDNEAPLEPFACLPQLVELDFQCNALHHVSIPANGFLSLEVLNLSFNCLTTRDVEELSNLLRIRELYLGSNGIRALPPVMDRFSKLETLSLEHNSLSGHEVFNFLAMMPRLRNLNVGHNKITAFPESALSVDSKRGAGFYNLVYLNLAHNKITDETDIAFTGELHSLRRLVLYGNPLTHAAVASHDQTKLNYDPIPTLHAFIAGTQRDLSVMVAYPDTKKKRHGTVAYENVEIYKMLPNDVPLPSPFRSRAVDVASDVKPKAAKPVEPISLAKPISVDTSDTTFLTGVGIEDVLSSPVHGSFDVLAEIPAVPASVITRSLEVNRQTNPQKARAAINALRYQLQHPLTSHDDSEIFPISSRRTTQAQIHRQQPCHPLQPERHRSPSAVSPVKKPYRTEPSPYRPLDGSRAIDDALTQLSYQVAKGWDKPRLQQQSDQGRLERDVGNAMDSLVATAQRVTLAFHPAL